MTVTLLASLLVLALIDSTSFGTLVIPIWLMLAPGRVRPGRVIVFLATVAVFYLGVGLLLLAGSSLVQDALGVADAESILAVPGVRVAELVLGLGLLVGSFAIDSPKRRAATGAGTTDGARPGRLTRWREQAMGATADGGTAIGLAGGTTADAAAGDTAAGGDGGTAGGATAGGRGIGGLVLLALAAALVEVGSMLPYLAGIGLIGTSSIDRPASALLLAGYCLVMIAPALVLLLVRIVAARIVEPPLRRFSDWLSRHAASTTAWIVGIVGFLLARDAAIALDLFAAWGA
jgi:hypothetical protein